MKGYFAHILPSIENDPIRFFREVVENSKLQIAINRFMPLCADSEGVTIYEPIGEYRNVDYLNLSYERNELDIDYRPIGPNDPDEVYRWITYSFKEILSKILMHELAKSQSLIHTYITASPENKNPRVQHLIESVNKIKEDLPNIQPTSIIEEFNNVIDSLCTTINEQMSNTESVTHRITRENLGKIWNFLTDKYNLDCDKNEFIEWFYLFNGKKIPQKELQLNIKSNKIIYYLLTQIHKIAPFDYAALSAAQLLWFNSKRKLTYFNNDYIGKYPTDVEREDQEEITRLLQA